MSTNYLLPFKSRYVGIALILIHIPIKFLWDAWYPGGFHASHPRTDASNDFLFSPPHLFFIGTTLMVFIGLFLIAFSRERIEDEQISQLRLESLRWAIYLNYALLLFSLLFTQGIDTHDILMLNIWLPLLFFILRFQWVLYRLNKSAKSDNTESKI